MNSTNHSTQHCDSKPHSQLQQRIQLPIKINTLTHNNNCQASSIYASPANRSCHNRRSYNNQQANVNNFRQLLSSYIVNNKHN